MVMKTMFTNAKMLFYNILTERELMETKQKERIRRLMELLRKPTESI